MNSAVGNSLIELLLSAGVPSRDEAAALSSNLNGGSWTTQVLDSGKVDENRFLGAIGDFFQVPVLEEAATSRAVLRRSCKCFWLSTQRAVSSREDLRQARIIVAASISAPATPAAASNDQRGMGNNL